MLPQAHAGLGWVLGVLPPCSDRRLRLWCVAAALLPDIDGVTMLFGLEAYGRWHHTFGHNIFLGMATVAAALLHYRRRPAREGWTAGALVAACFASHLLTDMKLSGWEVHLLWPFSRRGYGFHPIWDLGHPLNVWLVYGFAAAAALIPFWKPVTPLDLISSRLDRIFLNAFRRKTAVCATCQAPCNNVCDSCGRPACMKHGRLRWSFRMSCPDCALKA